MPKLKSQPEEEKKKYIDPLWAWESLRGEVFEEVAKATDSRRMAERELFVLVRPRFLSQFPDLTIPKSAMLGVSHSIYTEDDELRWHSVSEYHAYCDRLRSENSDE